MLLSLLLFCVLRTSFPTADIKRTLDAMSMVKLNQLHWHIVDSQSFPLVIPGYESLSTHGAYTPSSIYTPQDVSDLIAYAGARGIDVLFEIDTPGHTSVIGNAFPEHVACQGKTPWASYAAEPPAGQLRVTSEETRNFTSGMFGALAGMVGSAYVSTGGDEVNAACFEEDEEIQASLNATGGTIGEAVDAFVNVTHKALMGAGKTPVVWEGTCLA
jgi:hexosaminidase